MKNEFESESEWINHHFWAPTHGVVTMPAELRPLPVFWCFGLVRQVWLGSGCVSSSQWEHMGEAEMGKTQQLGAIQTGENYIGRRNGEGKEIYP